MSEYRRAMEAINAMSFASKGINSPFNACCFKDECRARLEREASLEAELAATKRLLASSDKTIADILARWRSGELP